MLKNIILILIICLIISFLFLLIRKSFTYNPINNSYIVEFSDINETSYNDCKNIIDKNYSDTISLLNNTIAKQQNLYGFLITSLSIFLAAIGIFTLFNNFIEKNEIEKKQRSLDVKIEETDLQISIVKGQLGLLKISREYNSIIQKPGTSLYYGDDDQIVNSKETLINYLEDLCKDLQYIRSLNFNEYKYTIVSLIFYFTEYSIANNFSSRVDNHFKNFVYHTTKNFIYSYLTMRMQRRLLYL